MILDSSKYTNKVDIWALGCIPYELVVGKKAFDSDWNIMCYYRGNEDSPRISMESQESHGRQFLIFDMDHHLDSVMRELLARSWSDRPRASEAIRVFYSYIRILDDSASTTLTWIPKPREWKALVQKHRTQKGFLFELGEVYDSVKDNNAVSVWAELVRCYPSEQEIRVRLADAYIRRGTFMNVIELLKEVIEAREDQATHHPQISAAWHKNNASENTTIFQLEELIGNQRTYWEDANSTGGLL